jgi:hypothetical protein
MDLLKFFESVVVAYFVGALAFGALMWMTLEGIDVTGEDGKPMPKKYFIITALVWPYSAYLLLQELKIK